MLYENKEFKFTINVFDEFQLVKKENYEKIGLKEPALTQTIYLFANTQNEDFDTFNITRDAVYKNEEEALTKGVELNISVLKASGATIVKSEDFILPSGRKIVRTIINFQGMTIANIFTSIHNMLVCLGYMYNEDLPTRNEQMLEIVNSIVEI